MSTESDVRPDVAETDAPAVADASAAVSSSGPASAIDGDAAAPLDDFDLDDLEARLNQINDLAASATDDVRTDTIASPATPSNDDAAADEEGGSLRSQLAEMFGVDMDSFAATESRRRDEASGSEEVALEPAAESTTFAGGSESGLRVDSASAAPADETPAVSFLPPVADPPVDDDEVRVTNELPPSAEEPAAAMPDPAPEPVREPAPAADGEESIADYMERLLARSRGTEPTSPEKPPEKPAAKPKPVAAKTPAMPSEPLADDLSPAVVTHRDRRFRKPINKDQLRREVSSLRELALMSSRAAVAKKQRADLKMQMNSRLVVVATAAIVSSVLLLSPLWSRESFVLFGGVGMVATIALGVRYFTEHRKLAAQLAEVQQEIDIVDGSKVDRIGPVDQDPVGPHSTDVTPEAAIAASAD